MTAKRPPLDFDAIKIAAHGNWINTIFPAVGIRLTATPKKGQPCPICGGHDRFRCDDKQGKGTWICNQCGAGDGFKLVELYTHTSDSYDLMKLIGGIMGVSATSSITPEQRAKWKADQVAKETAELKQKLENQDKAQAKAQHLWDNAQMTGNLEYINRKQIYPYAVRFTSSCMLIPMVKWIKETNIQILRNVQRIYPNGEKKPLFGGEVNHCYCPLGDDELFVNPAVILVGEGYATTMTIFMALQQKIPAVVAFTAGNIPNVVSVLRERFPNARIIICADDDIESAKKQRQEDIDNGKEPKPLEEYNAGVFNAKKAVKDYNAEMIIPNFSSIKAVA